MRRITNFTISQLPKNNALVGSCEAMIEAWNLQSKPHAVILFVITEGHIFSTFDQVRILTFHLPSF